jgi:hypothetical protein
MAIGSLHIYMNFTEQKVLIVKLLVSKCKTLKKKKKKLQMLNKSCSNTNFNTSCIYKNIRQLNVYYIRI